MRRFSESPAPWTGLSHLGHAWRRIVVHAIGIGEAAGSSFLESLAERTGGDYVGFK